MIVKDIEALEVLDSLVGLHPAVIVNRSGWSLRVTEAGPLETRTTDEGQPSTGQEITFEGGEKLFVVPGAKVEVGNWHLPSTQAGMEGYYTADLCGKNWRQVCFHKRSWLGERVADLVIDRDVEDLVAEIEPAVAATGEWAPTAAEGRFEALRVHAQDLGGLRDLVSSAGPRGPKPADDAQARKR